MSMVAKEEHD